MYRPYLKENETLNKEEAYLEATSCLNCKNPTCVKGCPAGLKINEFIQLFKEGNIDGAYRLILNNSPLSFICTVVCNHESQCLGHCVKNKMKKPVRIPLIEKYIAYNANHRFSKPKKIGKSVAIVGSGPSSLSAAYYLASAGIKVDIYEAKPHVGGILSYGIPSFRLSTENLDKTLEILKDLGVNFYVNSPIDDLETLKKDYDRIYLGIGLGTYRRLGLPNDGLPEIYDAGTFLERYNSETRFKEGERIKVDDLVLTLGGGNVALDAVRTAIRCGALNSTIVYRRGLEDMPASQAEKSYALNEKIAIQPMLAPHSIEEENRQLKSITFKKMEYSGETVDGRRGVRSTDKTETWPAKHIILALGQELGSPEVIKTLKTDGRYLSVDMRMQTSDPLVYAGGDLVSGPSNVAKAVSLGRRAALSLIEDLN